MEVFEPARRHESPVANLRTKLGDFMINHYDSRMRLFDKETDAEFNHVEFIHEGRIMAFKLTDELMDLLMEKQWPYLVMPYVDVDTFEWLMSVDVEDIPETLDDLDLG